MRALTGATFALLAFTGLTGAATAPDLGSPEAYAASQQRASVERTGTDLVITGAIGDIFASRSFLGPNRAEKVDRFRPTEDVIALTRHFDSVRSHIAALRNPKTAIDMPVVADLPGEDASVTVAALDPGLSSAALDAIDAMSSGDAPPIPRMMSEKLAYARAELPATVFDGAVKDKSGTKVSDKEVWCMATAIYFEARGETYRGQVAVGQVVMNRVGHRLYPNTICGVVFQNQHKRNACQFSFACDGIPERINDKKSWELAMKIAKLVIPGTEYLTEVGYSTHYHATYVYPHWAPRMKKNTKIGLHVFYQFKRGWKYG